MLYQRGRFNEMMACHFLLMSWSLIHYRCVEWARCGCRGRGGTLPGKRCPLHGSCPAQPKQSGWGCAFAVVLCSPGWAQAPLPHRPNPRRPACDKDPEQKRAFSGAQQLGVSKKALSLRVCLSGSLVGEKVSVSVVDWHGGLNCVLTNGSK